MLAITMDVPATHVRALAETALALYAVKIDAILFAAEAYLGDQCSLAELSRHREEVGAIVALLDQLGWQRGVRHADVSLTAAPSLLTELVESALLNSLEALPNALRSPSKPNDLTHLVQCLDEASDLAALLVRLLGRRQATSA